MAEKVLLNWPQGAKTFCKYNNVFQKMVFIYNSVENGWDVKKNGDQYVFLKPHEGKKDVYTDEYLDKFINYKKQYNISLHFN